MALCSELDRYEEIPVVERTGIKTPILAKFKLGERIR